MKFEFLVLADAMNFGPEGKVNILGMGWRQVVVAQLPAPLSFAIVASLTGPVSDAGEHVGEFCVVLPDGTEEMLARGPVVLPEPRAEATSIGLAFGLDVIGKQFAQPGLYTIRATIGPVSAEYQFRVTVGAVGVAPEASSAAAPAKPRKQRAKAS